MLLACRLLLPPASSCYEDPPKRVLHAMLPVIRQCDGTTGLGTRPMRWTWWTVAFSQRFQFFLFFTLWPVWIVCLTMWHRAHNHMCRGFPFWAQSPLGHFGFPRVRRHLAADLAALDVKGRTFFWLRCKRQSVINLFPYLINNSDNKRSTWINFWR